jgi:hypothetical protein
MGAGGFYMRIDRNSQVISAQMQQKAAGASKRQREQEEGVAAVVDRMHMDITDQGSGRVTNAMDASELTMSLKDRIMGQAGAAVSAQANVNPDFVSTIV